MADDTTEFDTTEFEVEIKKTAENKEIHGATREDTGIYVDYRSVDIYELLTDGFTGGGGFSGRTFPIKNSLGQFEQAKSYILPNPTENFYLTRIKNSAFKNLLKNFVLAPIKGVFADRPKTVVCDSSKNIIKDHPYEDFIKNITGSGSSKNVFYKNTVLPQANLDSCVFVVIDKSDNINSQPYAYIKKASSVLDYKTDFKGDLLEITFANQTIIDDDNNVRYSKTVWGMHYFNTYISNDGEKWVLEKEVPNQLGCLPVYNLRTGDYSTEEILPPPALTDIIYLIADLYNKNCTADWIAYKQGYSRLVINADSTSDIAYGTDNALVIPTGEKIFQPYNLAPDSDIVKTHYEIIERKEKELIDLMGDLGVSVQTVTPESGIAKSYNFIASNFAKKNIVTICQELDEWVFKIYNLYNGDSNPSYTAETFYPKTFTPEVELSLSELLELAEYYESRNMRFNLAGIQRKILQKTNPQASELDNQEFLDEISDGIIKGNE